MAEPLNPPDPSGPLGRVVGLWRYPVKSMGGGPVDEVRLGPRGVHGDRLWAVRDLGDGRDGRVATARRVPELLGCRARWAAEPPADAGPGRPWPVTVTLPDGTELTSDDDRVHEALGEVVGRRVRLEPLPSDRRAHRGGLRTAAAIRAELGLAPDEPLPDASFLDARTLARLAVYSTPPGSYVDVAAVHVLTTADLQVVDADVRRFRPSVLVDSPARAREWTDLELRAGGSRLRVSMPTIRCVVPGLAQADLDADPAVPRRVAKDHGRFLGAYADVSADGRVRVGDEVAVAGRRTVAPVVRRLARPALRLGSRLLP